MGVRCKLSLEVPGRSAEAAARYVGGIHTAQHDEMRQRRIHESNQNADRRSEAGIEMSRLIALIGITSLFAAGCSAGVPGPPTPTNDGTPFHLIEASISGIHDAYRSKQLTTRGLVELYLARIAAYDKTGPSINAVITISPKALEDADRLDKAFAASGFVGPLHGIQSC